MEKETIKLYPSNWLYNAGVVGFLRVVEACGEQVEDCLQDDGSVEIKSFPNSDTLFDKWDDITREKLKISYKGKMGGTKKYYYANQTENSIKNKINQLTINKPLNGRKYFNYVCDFCGKEIFLKKSNLNFLSQGFGNILITSERTFPNSYWNNKSNVFICPKCEFIIMCHHISLTTLSDNSELFINAPSFKIMWFLNKYAKIYEKEEIKEVKQILGMSLIEMASKLYIQIGRWEKMNIEVVSKFQIRNNKKPEDKVEFFSLSESIVDLISDREIAVLLKDIGEFKILNMVLDGKFREILELGEKLFRISMLPPEEFDRMNRSRNRDARAKYIDTNVFLARNKEVEKKLSSIRLTNFSQKLFKLYALIDAKIRKEVGYGI